MCFSLRNGNAGTDTSPCIDNESASTCYRWNHFILKDCTFMYENQHVFFFYRMKRYTIFDNLIWQEKESNLCCMLLADLLQKPVCIFNLWHFSYMIACTHQLQSIVYFQIIVVTGVTGFQLKKWKTELYNLRKQWKKNSVSSSLEANTCRWKSSLFLQVETSIDVDFVSVNNKRITNNYV